MQMPRMPSSAMRGRVAGFISCLRSHSPIVGITSFWVKSRTILRACVCSSFSEKSMSKTSKGYWVDLAQSNGKYLRFFVELYHLAEKPCNPQLKHRKCLFFCCIHPGDFLV